MHKLDPIERLPDGTLFRLTPGQLRSVRGLAKRCCNFSDGDCLLLDGVCPQYISRSLLCRWFRRAVLPQQPKLEQAILRPKKLHRCEVCGTGIGESPFFRRRSLTPAQNTRSGGNMVCGAALLKRPDALLKHRHSG